MVDLHIYSSDQAIMIILAYNINFIACLDSSIKR